MSRLYATEEGRVIPTLCEELTWYRRARKRLDLPATKEPARLYFLARACPESDHPLRLAVNGAELEAIPPGPEGVYLWREVEVEPSLLREGENQVEFWTDSTAMDAWALALEAGHPDPGSALTDDGGVTWRSERMGYLNAVRGEYVVRIRLAEGADPDPPEMVWEDPDGPRAASLRRLLPAAALQEEDLMPRVRALSAWLSSSWEHTSSGRAAQYAPWDAETILAWGKRQTGHSGQRPIVMCVHYAVAFASACQVAGIPARCAVLTGTPNGFDGHFVAEVWFEEYEKWVMVDPNCDAVCWKEGKPLSIPEIQREGEDLGRLIEYGEGTKFQRRFPHMIEFLRDNLEKGVCFRHRSVWPRADLLSRPDLSPPGHGSTAYCETALVWERRDLERGLGMFRYFADPAYFDAPPPSA